MNFTLSEILLTAAIAALIVLVSTGIVAFFFMIGIFISMKVDSAISARRDKNLRERSELYKAIQNNINLFDLNKDNIEDILKLRNSWSSLKKVTHEQKLLLIAAGYKIDTAQLALATFDDEALKVQAELYAATKNSPITQ